MSGAIFFNNNSNDGNLHYGGINITERPICAEKGFSCPALYSTIQLISYFTTVADFIIISFLVYLSIVKVKDGLFKYFTLNLMAICSMITISDLMIDITNIVDLFTNVSENTKNSLVLVRLEKTY
ncbi:hypothetical protein LOAG_13114 [Loa loa]|uniref:Uncharacterized protein n=1 Tax=Loa loa TaxID=7209 RepID=A0A1S0TLG3_LOALO|nr:hypothetical protein LOAG_13114 [Loa loa]EFO15398.1 hypothetical protein LOAG_13114 [Loa loa]